MSKTKVPVVAIVGRANVGKSSLFNRVVGKQQAVVADEAGTTRDRVMARVEQDDKSFWLVDTAGFKAAEDDFEATIQEQIIEATDAADVIVVVVDSTTDITEEDRRVAKLALKSKKPTILAINKSDKSATNAKAAWEKTGIKDRFAVSAMHGKGVGDLFTHIATSLPKAGKGSSEGIRIALVGRPNVGKSHLFNTLAKKQQAIVADVAGTTRDVNRTTVMYHGEQIHLLDTAGIRRPGKIERGVEHFSVLRTLQAIEEADVCLFLMDANELNTHLDQRIAGMIKESGKGMVIVVSKWDSVEKDAYTRDELAPKIADNFTHVWWAPLIFTSSVTGQNVSKLFDIVKDIYDKRQINIKTPRLNDWLEDAMLKHPPAGLKSKHPRLRYITQTDNNPPTFQVFGKDVKYLHWSYRRYLEREFREEYELGGTPVKFYWMDQEVEKAKKGKKLDEKREESAKE